MRYKPKNTKSINKVRSSAQTVSLRDANTIDPETNKLTSGFGTVINSIAAMAGAGTSGDPYIIMNWTDLQLMMTKSDRLTAYWKLGADIDASASSALDGGAGWTPVGTNAAPFTGNFNGNYHIIDGLFINRVGSDQAFLGEITSSVVKNVFLTNLNITGSTLTDTTVGGIIGDMNSGTVSGCYTTGSITGAGFAGGVIGRCRGGTITNCYSSCSVTSSDNYVGGFCGLNDGTITNCHSTGSVTGSYDGGFCGHNDDTITNCFWDTQTSGQATSSGGTGKTTAQMKAEATFTNWNFDTIWTINEGQDYPKLLVREHDSYVPNYDYYYTFGETVTSTKGNTFNAGYNFANTTADSIAFGIGGIDLLITANSANFQDCAILTTGTITGTSFVVGANTLTATEWAFLDGQDQSVFKTSSPTFVGLTLGGVLTDTLLAANATGLDINGDTNPFVYAGTFSYINRVVRTINGSGATALPTLGYMFYRNHTWDYDYTGSATGINSKRIYAGGEYLDFTGNINISSLGLANPTFNTGASTSGLVYSGQLINSTTRNVTLNAYGTSCTNAFTSTINYSSAGTLTANIYGGYFNSTATPVLTAGTVNLNFYGGYFGTTGSGIGTSVSYGGYFSGTGSGTNYDIYAVNATSLNYFAGPTTCNTTFAAIGQSTFTLAPIVNTLTAGRVIFAGASKELVDDADITFATDTLTVAKVKTTTPMGYAEMYIYNNTTLICGIDTINTYHAVFQGFGNNDGTLAPLIDTTYFTYKAGVGKTVSAYTDYNPPTTTITQVTTSTDHTLLAGEPVTITGTTNYNGTYSVLAVINATNFTITKAYVADDATGSVRRPATLKCLVSGSYRMSFNVSGTPANPNDNFKFELNRDTTTLDNCTVRGIWSSTTKYESMAASGLDLLTAGQYLWLSVKNYTGTGDLTLHSANVNVSRLI